MTRAEYHKAWREAHPENVARSKRKWRKANPEKHANQTKAWRKANPDKHCAYAAVENAIKKGRLVRPLFCEQCNSKGRIEAHHKDYSKRLEVEWLCPRCHHNQ